MAVTRFCEQPGLRTVGGTKDPDVAGIVGLRPDLVVANDEENRKEDVDALTAAGVSVHVVHVAAVADVAPAMAALRAALGLGARPAADPLPPPRPPTRRAFVPIWRRPWMTLGAGTYGSSVLAHLGVANVYADAGRYPETTLEDARRRRPDVVLAPSEPYPFAERHRSELEAVAPVVLVDGQDLFWWGSRTPEAIERLGEVLG